MSDFKAFIERLKDAVVLSEVIAKTHNFTFRRHGRYMRCDDHPSLIVDDERGWFEWYSKGSERAGRGDVINWLMEHTNNREFRQAVDWLGDLTGLRYEWNEKQTAAYKKQQARSNTLALIVDFLHKRLLASDEADFYTMGRGWSEETVKEARLGWWDGDYDDLRGHLVMHGVNLTEPLVVSMLGYKGDVLKWCEHYGFDPKKLPLQWLQKDFIPGLPKAKMLIYPNLERGRVVYLAGRRIAPKEGQSKSYNLRSSMAGARRPYFNHVYSKRAEFVVVVEGQADAITLAQWDVPAIALCGTKGTDALVGVLKQHATIYIGLDTDAAGKKAMQGLAEALGPATPIVTWPGGDANDWLKKDAPTREDCLRLLANAPMYALWYANHWQEVPEIELENSRRYAYELMASLMPYDYASNAQKLANAMGGIEPMKVSELNSVIRAIRQERDLAAMGVEDAQPVKDRPKLKQNPLDNINGEEISEALQDLLMAQSRDHEGHARCVKALHGDKIAFVPEWGWVAYNGRYWERDGAEHIVEGFVVDTLKKRRHFAVQNELEGLVKATPCSRRNVTSTQSMVEKLVLKRTEDFDSHPDLLNCANGVVDLRTGQLMDHDSGYLFMYCTPTNYKPKADYAEWLMFLISAVWKKSLNGVFVEDAELMEWLQMAVGYSLSGRTSENCLFYIYGPTRSGKGTFLQTLLKLLGKPLSGTLDFHVLTNNQSEDSQNFALAPFKPCRVVVGNEPNKYDRFNEGKMKALTGEDAVRCSFKRRDHFEYEPQFKIWLSANWPFNADPLDDAAWGRARIIHFPNSYLGMEDKTLKQRMQSQQGLEGVLAWAVEGAVKWYGLGEVGLTTPEAVRDMSNTQKTASDFLQLFLEECFEIFSPGDQSVWVTIRELKTLYQNWSKDMGVTAMKSKNFNEGMRTKGFDNNHKVRVDLPNGKKKQVRVWYGLKPYDEFERGSSSKQSRFKFDKGVA